MICTEYEGKYYIRFDLVRFFPAGTRSGKTIVESTYNSFVKEFDNKILPIVILRLVKDIGSGLIMGSIGSISSVNANNITKSSVDQVGYEDATDYIHRNYKDSSELVEIGFKALNDFSLSSLVKSDNIIASDNQPWNNRVVYFIWDKDFKKWMKVAERKY